VERKRLKSWQERFQEKQKDEEEKKKSLVLVEVKESEDCRCGSCDKPFKIEVYYSSGKLKRRVTCENCGTEFWLRE
jgi:hypothetical protein